MEEGELKTKTRLVPILVEVEENMVEVAHRESPKGNSAPT